MSLLYPLQCICMVEWEETQCVVACMGVHVLRALLYSVIVLCIYFVCAYTGIMWKIMYNIYVSTFGGFELVLSRIISVHPANDT